MLPKANLTLHSRTSGSRWVITPSWLPRSWRPFLYSFSVYSCHPFTYLRMKCSHGISNFLEEISSLSHSVVFLYFFALIRSTKMIKCCYFLVAYGMKPGLQPRVLNLQEIGYRTVSMRVKGFSPTVDTKTWTNKLKSRFYYLLVLIGFSSSLPGWFPLA